MDGPAGGMFPVVSCRVSSQKRIRNFSIIAHIDHGKSTLADRILMHTGAVTEREFREQFLDDMDLEREMGITIKANRATVAHWHDGQEYMLNLLDTPGHVDFHYEVSRALAACEGVLLLVDAAQGVQAQTVANAYKAVEADLTVIPVINKIDLPGAFPEDVALELEHVLGIPAEDAIFTSAKTGQGVDEALSAIIERIPPPKGDRRAKLRAMVYDAKTDIHRGVICHVRVIDGELTKGDKITFLATGARFVVADLGKFMPKQQSVERLAAGEVGYVFASIKTIEDIHIGDTITLTRDPSDEPLLGYAQPQQMVFCDFYPGPSSNTGDLRKAMEDLWLNDNSFTFETVTSDALGIGFRCGFLGLLHMKIVQERLERESNIAAVQTAPTVTYEIALTEGTTRRIESASEMPDPTAVSEIREPIVRANMIVPAGSIGAIMQMSIDRRGTYIGTEYLSQTRAMLTYELPLAEIIYDFYDKLKSATQGYGTMDYELTGFRAGNLVKMNILVNGKLVDALSVIVHRDKAELRGRRLAKRLAKAISRHQFAIPIQAAIGGKIIARETVRPFRKDVTAKLYGGDVTRKMKLLEKQKKGKRRMKQIGNVEIPQEAFMAVLDPGE